MRNKPLNKLSSSNIVCSHLINDVDPTDIDINANNKKIEEQKKKKIKFFFSGGPGDLPDFMKWVKRKYPDDHRTLMDICTKYVIRTKQTSACINHDQLWFFITSQGGATEEFSVRYVEMDQEFCNEWLAIEEEKEKKQNEDEEKARIARESDPEYIRMRQEEQLEAERREEEMKLRHQRDLEEQQYEEESKERREQYLKSEEYQEKLRRQREEERRANELMWELMACKKKNNK